MGKFMRRLEKSRTQKAHSNLSAETVQYAAKLIKDGRLTADQVAACETAARWSTQCGAFESDNRATLDEDFKLFIQAELSRT